MIEILSVFVASFVFTYVTIPWFIPRLLKAGISGRDMNKAKEVEVAEMGGFPIIGGFIVGVLLAIALTTFQIIKVEMRIEYVLAALSTILLTALIGVIDDLLRLDQRVKALLPVFAAMPLVAIRMGVTTMSLPFFGNVDFGLLYPLLIIPLAITGASNATNMLAGFNGLEAGLGAIMCATIALIALPLAKIEVAVLALAMLGALLAFLRYNWFPARILIGDVGTLSIGAVIATSVIVGNIEKAGIILIAPFFMELYLKARSRFKAQSWCRMKAGKLVCESATEVYGMGRLVMYLFGGVSEKRLVMTLICVEVCFAVLTLYVYFVSPVI
jgi:UDP-N-acetylglucosamine--dolichyl-phosphate N-acetylglucosaminephosphotransferase